MGRPAEKAGEKPKEVASNGDEWVLKAACTKREKPRRAFKTVVGESVVVEGQNQLRPGSLLQPRGGGDGKAGGGSKGGASKRVEKP